MNCTDETTPSTSNPAATNDQVMTFEASASSGERTRTCERAETPVADEDPASVGCAATLGLTGEETFDIDLSVSGEGLVEPLFDVDQLTGTALRVLEDPAAFAPLGAAARARIEEAYSLEACIPRLKDYFERMASAGKRRQS